MTASDLTSDQVRRALLDQNYIPRASRRGDDLPPSLTTLGMHTVSKLLVDRHTVGNHRHPKKSRAVPGYSVSSARVAHYRWNPRRVEIPYPIAYANLVETIATHWDSDVAPRMNSTASQFTVRQHPDGRIASMQNSRPSLRPGVGSRFRVRTDVASFYDSIYTHAIPWALMGKAAAKADRYSALPANEIDGALRFARRGETTGISIGPGTSLIVAELLLSRVDEHLQEFRFERFLDDYVAYTRTDVEAEDFVRRLDHVLRDHGLRLSGRKTVIEALPLPDEPGWIRELRRSNRDRPSELIDRAVELSRADPQASAIRWVISRLRQEVAEYSSQDSKLVIQRLAELAFTHPHTTPALVDIVLATESQMDPADVDVLLQKHSSDAQSSAVCWLLHLAWSRDQPISEASWETIAASSDPLSSAYLLQSRSPHHSERREAMLTSVGRPSSDEYSCDEWWPARYIAFLNGREEAESPGFVELRDAGVRLMRDPRHADDTSAESDSGDQPREQDTGVQADDEWITLGFSG